MSADHPVPGELLRCPDCGWAGLVGPERPRGLPSWVCLQCGHTAGGQAETPNGRAEARRYKAMLARLGSRNAAIREAEVHALVALGSPAVPVLAQVLKRSTVVRNRAQEAAVFALGRIGTAEAVDVLLQALADHERQAKRRRKWAPYVIAGFAAVVTITVIAGMVGGGHIHINPGGYVATIFLLVAARAIGLRKGAAGALAALGEPRAVGPLALAAEESRLRTTALPILKDLMPKVREEHIQGFSAEEQAAIVRLLMHSDEELARRALRLVAMFGAADALGAVQWLVEKGPEPLRAEAASALEAIQRRIEAQKDKETLLRASSSLEAMSADTLLRPAAGEPEQQSEQLLRRAPEDEPTP